LVLLPCPSGLKISPRMVRAAHDVATDRLANTLASATAAASVVAAAAPALCAVHCAAMPIAAVLLPSLQASGGKVFGRSVCMHAVARKLAYYFVIPCGLLSNAVSYPKHESVATTTASLTGISFVTAAAAWAAAAPYRTALNLSGCALMLGSTAVGNRLAEENGRGCSGCSTCEGC